MQTQSEQIDKLAEAVATAQADLSAVKRNKEVTVRPRAGGQYKFSYATLDAIIEAVRPVFTKHGLWFYQSMIPAGQASEPDGQGSFYAGNMVALRTVLMHKSGQWIASEMMIKDDGSNQEFGSTLTFRRRYALSGLLGIAADSDDDANMSDQNEIVAQSERTPSEGARAKQPEAAGTPSGPEKLARDFGQETILKLRAMKKLSELENWSDEKTLQKVDRLASYDKDLHRTVLTQMEATRKRLQTGDEGSAPYN